MLQIPGNSRPSARSICRELVDTVARVYTPDLGVAHIDLHEATTDRGPPAGAGPLALVDLVARVYTPDLGVAHIDLHEATTDPGPHAGAGPLAFVDLVVAIDTPDPPRTNRYMLQPPGNSRP